MHTKIKKLVEMKRRGYTHCSAGRCRIATLQLSAKWSFVQSIYWFRYLRNNVDLDKREHQYFNHIKQKSYIWTQIVVLIQTLRHFQGLVMLQIYMYHWYLNSIKPERNTQNGSSYFVIPSRIRLWGTLLTSYVSKMIKNTTLWLPEWMLEHGLFYEGHPTHI